MAHIWEDSASRVWEDSSDRIWEDTLGVVVATPIAVPSSGEYLTTQTIVLTTTTVGANIYYTTDGSTPDATDTLYTTPITIFIGTLKAIGIKSGDTDSNILTEVYDISAVATPVIDPVSGDYITTQLITLTTATSGADLYYTTDGSDPTELDLLYSTPLAMFTGQLKVIGIKAGYLDSSISSANYVLLSWRGFNPYCVDPNTLPYTDCETCPSFDPNDPFALTTLVDPFLSCLGDCNEVCPASKARLTSHYVEVLRKGVPFLRVSNEYVEVLRSGDPRARLTSTYVEALRKN